MPISNYQSLLTKYTTQAQALRIRLGWFSFLRLLFFCGFIFLGYKAIQTGDRIFIMTTIASLAIFLLFIRWYDKLQAQTLFYKELVQLNQREIDFLSGKPSSYPRGDEYIDPHHPYSYDLDLFGEGGLFSYINRTNGLQELRKQYNANKKLLEPIEGSEIDNRISAYFAVVLLSGQLVSQELGVDPYPIVNEIFKETLEERSTEGDMPTRALQETISFAQANEKSFLGKSDNTVKEHYGVWKDAEYIAFYPHKLKEFLGKSGFSYNSDLRSWAERKWIRKSKEGYSHPIRYEKSIKRFILIEFPVVS